MKKKRSALDKMLRALAKIPEDAPRYIIIGKHRNPILEDLVFNPMARGRKKKR
jgi:hypothetical protein